MNLYMNSLKLCLAPCVRGEARERDANGDDENRAVGGRCAEVALPHRLVDLDRDRTVCVDVGDDGRDELSECEREGKKGA